MNVEPSELGLRSETLTENTVKKRSVVSLTDSTISEASHTTKKSKYCSAKVNHGLLFRPQELSYDTLHKSLSSSLLSAPNQQLFNTAEVRNGFENLYKYCIKHHLVQTLPTVISKHLNYVLSLLKCYSNYADVIGDEILYLHNITNHNECKNVIAILQTDFTVYNAQYLGSIKMLLLQYLLKSPAEEKYKMPLVTFFSKDQRFLYGGQVSTIKPMSILKVLLHLFTKYPDLKPLFGMKILQYQSEFGIPFETLVKSSTLVKFEKVLVLTASQLESKYHEFIHVYFAQCPLTSHVKKSEMYHPTSSSKTFVINERWLAKVEKSFSHTDNLKIYQLYYHYLHYLYSYSIPFIKEHSTLLDQILLTINTNLKSFYANPSLLNSVKATIYYMGEYLFDHKQYKKLANVINVAFNLYVTHNTDDLLKLAANLQMKLYYKLKEKDIWPKFKKFIKCSFSMELKFTIFSQIYNIFAIMASSELQKCCEFVFDGCVELSNLLPGLQLEELDFTSSLMNCLLYSQTAKKKHQIPIESWPVLVQMLYQTLDPYVELSAFDVNTQINKRECLHDNQVLIKCMYSLYLEMKKRRCVNLKTITQSYIEKRVKKNSFEESVIENLFVLNLASYLNFNNNYELVKYLYESIPQSYVKTHIEKFFIEAESQLTGRYDKQHVSIATFDAKMNLLDRLTQYEIILQQALATHDTKFFQTTFSVQLPFQDPSVFDIRNKGGEFSNKEYTSIILFNASLFLTAGKLSSHDNKHVNAFHSFVKALSLSNSLIKKSAKLVQNARVQLLNLIVACYDCLLEECVFMNLTSQFEYFVKEYISLSQVITDPVIQFEAYYSARFFAKLTNDNGYVAMTKKDMHLLDMDQNLVAFGKLGYIDSNVSLLLKKYEQAHYFLLTKWLIKSGIYLESISTSANLLNKPEVTDIDYKKLSMIDLRQYWMKREYHYKIADYVKSCSGFFEKQCSFNDKDFSPTLLMSSMTAHNPDIDAHTYPTGHNIVSLDICFESSKLIVSKFLNGSQSHFSLAVTRRNAKYNSFTALINAFKDIVDLSNGTTAAEVTSCVKTKEDRKKWWETRFELDSEMGNLLKYIEEEVLGAFVNVFAPYYIDHNEPEFQKFELEAKALGIDFDMQHLSLLLNQKNTKDLIEHGVIDEHDLALLVTLLEKHAAQLELCKKPVTHTVLITNNQAHSIPWESMPILEAISVSRMPSLESLHVLLERQEQSLQITKNDIAMIINPNGDLPKTQSRFEHLINGCESVMVNEKPTCTQFITMLKDHRAFVYIGHGSGDQYVRVSEIKKSADISASFLLGCSSAYMKPRGQMGSTGTIIGYLLGGAPFVVGNLWDVTDKDIDMFSLSMFEKMGFSNTKSNERQNVAAAVSMSRKVCKLRYLNGAAPIVYGLPIEIKIL